MIDGDNPLEDPIITVEGVNASQQVAEWKRWSARELNDNTIGEAAPPTGTVNTKSALSNCSSETVGTYVINRHVVNDASVHIDGFQFPEPPLSR